MPKYTESDIQSAIAAVQSGVSSRSAASRWGIPRSTLYGRINGAVPMKAAKEPRQRLTAKQERDIKNLIIIQETLGLPMPLAEVKQLASRVLLATGDRDPLGKNWLDGFLRRHPDIHSARGVLTGSKSAGAPLPLNQ